MNKLLMFEPIDTSLFGDFVLYQPSSGSLTNRIETMIKERFGLDIPIFVISKEDLEDILQHAPAWWGDVNKKIYDNLIFIMAPATFAEVWGEIGEPREGLEKIKKYKAAVFWSFSRKDYQKTNWWRETASANISGKLTIRTANTVRKIAGMQLFLKFRFVG